MLIFKLLGNLLTPSIAGLLCFVFFIYFILIKREESETSKKFAIFLLSFGLFLISRPLQILLGPHPLPLIINNLRLLLFCSMTVPMVLLLTHKDEKVKHLAAFTIGGGILLGIIYGVFNILGTQDSYILFKLGYLSAHDNLTPSLQPPFFGREVTISVSIVMGLCLLISAGFRISMLGKALAQGKELERKHIYYNLGILIFGLSLIVGAIVKQWWIYYAISLLSITLLGYGVILDIREIRIRMEKVISFLKEDLIQNIILSSTSENEINNMLKLIGKKNRLDTFLVVKMSSEEPDTSKRIDAHQRVAEISLKVLSQLLDQADYLLMPLGSRRIGICVSVLQKLQEKPGFLIDLSEQIRQEVSLKTSTTVTIGIGSSYKKLDQIWRSYHEALNAQEYAEHSHGNNVQQTDVRISYPFTDKAELLQAVRLGDNACGMKILPEFFNQLNVFSRCELNIMKSRVYELIGSFVDSAILGGGDEEKLFTLSRDCFAHINNTRNIKSLGKRLEAVFNNITDIVTEAHQDRSKSIVNKARVFIENNYQAPLSARDVAGEVFISPSYFKHLFKKESGYSFTDYITSIRLQKARDLLLHSELTITNIAFEVGYQDSNYFSTLFKKIEGVTPSHYRKNHQ